MSDLSIQNRDRNSIFQLFCGRLPQANIIDHPGEVFKRLLEYDWLSLKQTFDITHIYLLGVWNNSGPILVSEERGQDLRFHEKRCPSPFAISNHQEFSPLLGSQADFAALVEKIHDCQLKLLVDFVPNHTGVAHYWVTNHPEYYKLDQHNVPQPAFSGDVLELNYESPELRSEMKDVLHNAAKLRIDGVRCDMAHLIPCSFWQEAIASVHEYFPEFQFVAEAYSSSVFDLTPQIDLIKSGFDAVYNEPLYRNIKQFSNTGLAGIMGHVEYVLHHNSQKWIHYISNHDDVFPLNSDRMWSYQQLCLLLPGWNLIYNGSLGGFSGRLAHHWIDVLPTEYELVSDEKLKWFEWYTSEKPVLHSFDIASDHTINAHWISEKTSGTISLEL